MTQEQFQEAISMETDRFKEYYLWLESSMPRSFFEELSKENVMLIVHNLMGFEVQEHYSTIHLKNADFVLCLDSPDADIRVLKQYAYFGIKNYQVYVSKAPLPFTSHKQLLRIALIYFNEVVESSSKPFSAQAKKDLWDQAKASLPHLTDKQFDTLIAGINTRFLGSLPTDRLLLALNMFFRAQTRDSCQYEVRYNDDWEINGKPSMNIVLAWRNTPKYNFLFLIAQIVNRHGLVIKKVNATYMNTYLEDNILVMALDLHGANGEAAWQAANTMNFLRELLTVKYFSTFDVLGSKLVSTGLISGNMGNLLRSVSNFINQSLVNVDPNLYTLETIQESLCRHPELTIQLCKAFAEKFDPDFANFSEYLKTREHFLTSVGKLDTGQEENDLRDKTVLRQGMNFIHFTLKTNFYRTNLTAHSFRLDPRYLDEIPFDRAKKFPEIPFAIFYIKGMHYIGFHIRFKDLARGGLRTVYPQTPEHVIHERNNIFTECYNLAFTQHLKNKDIPEGGSKGVLFINPYDQLDTESAILKKELETAGTAPIDIEKQVAAFRKAQRINFLHQVQRSYVESLLTIINFDAEFKLRARNIIDYYKKPEYIYIGPDENMHDEMIQWIADTSKRYNYIPGSAFISSKPIAGINHKHFGVTSLGVNVYMVALLKYLGIDPARTPFTVKMSGGPDGDVAGNQIANLYKHFSKTAKLLAIVDVSGAICDPEGLNLEVLYQLFREGKPVRFFPPEELSHGGYLLDKSAQRIHSNIIQQTLCWRMNKGSLTQEWLGASEANNLMKSTVNKTKTDIFIPAGGRPRTLDQNNIHDFLDGKGIPTSKGIVEGANLYLTPRARSYLENLGVLIIKDSSANKAGVICSSFEVLCSLTISDEEFVKNKETLVHEILERLASCAAKEAEQLLQTHKKTDKPMTEISDHISKKINLYTYQLLDFLDAFDWSNDSTNPLTQCFLNYCLPSLRERYPDKLLANIPDHHKKAIVACTVASNLIYLRGADWEPSIVDVLPLLLKEVKN